MIINNEIRDIIPALTANEYGLLRESLISEGLREPLIVWRDTLVDGHNRYSICKDNNIEIRTQQKEFDNIDSVINWIITNQLARRNLNDWQKYQLLEKKRELYVKKAKENLQTPTGNKTSMTLAKNAKVIETINTQSKIAKDLNWGSNKVAQADIVRKQATPEVKEQLQRGEISIHKAYSDIKKVEKQEQLKEKKIEIIADYKKEIKLNPEIYCEDYKDFLNRIEDKSQDLLITDPPYSTDIDNIEEFATDWINKALPKVKDNGRVYICIGAYPKELQTYLKILLNQNRFILDNPLIWTYRNTLGKTPNMKYNLNYQMVLHLYSKDSNPLDTSITNEMFSVQDINAPDGRQGDRHHIWQKPNELARRLIKHSTKVNDKIFDIFACTGTFLLMGAKLDRQVIGCDISRENLEIAKERGCEVL